MTGVCDQLRALRTRNWNRWPREPRDGLPPSNTQTIATECSIFPKTLVQWTVAFGEKETLLKSLQAKQPASKQIINRTGECGEPWPVPAACGALVGASSGRIWHNQFESTNHTIDLRISHLQRVFLPAPALEHDQPFFCHSKWERLSPTGQGGYCRSSA